MNRREVMGALGALGLQSMDLNVVLFGRSDPPPQAICVEAGPLQVTLEPELGSIRFLRSGDREIVRRIYAAVRDRHWRTVPPRIGNFKLDREAGGFRASFDAVFLENDIDFRWTATIKGTADGVLRFSIDGVAGSTFLRNRIGFCVLHPMSAAGQPCIVEHTDGNVDRGRFPDLISPHQPYKDIRAITYAGGEVRFEGDVFEMEDQRNWSDASFKTYCTPLDRPYPAKVERGWKLHQAVTFTLKARPSVPKRTRVGPVQFDRAAGSAPLPLIGFGCSEGETGSTDVKRLRALKPAHLRVDLRLDEAGWSRQFRSAWDLSSNVGAGLEAAVFLADNPEAELRALAEALDHEEARIARFLIFNGADKVTTAKTLALAQATLGPRAAGKLAAGTNTYFTEVNRERPPLEGADVICYSLNPQVHATDDTTLVENVAAQAETVRSARAFAAGKWVAVTPVTLSPRFNPHVPGSRAAADTRQRGLFAAAWTLGSLKYLAEARAGSITYFETAGPAGLMDGSVFPLYHVFADVAELSSGDIVPVSSNDPLKAIAMLVTRGDSARFLAANLTGVPVEAGWPAWLGKAVRIRILSASQYLQATSDPERWREESWTPFRRPATVELPPYSVLTVDAALR